MAEPDEKAPEAPKEEIPAFKFSPKKVDDSWKEEARKEREAAAAARAAAAAKTAAAQAAAASEAVAAAAPAGAPVEGAPATSAAEPSSTPTAPGAAEAGVPATTPTGKQPTQIEQQQTKIFLNFVDGLAQQALMQLGEIENPYTGQAEMDLQGARYTIELLAVIMAKTHGNLTETEHKALTGVLNDLKAHFATIAQELQRQMAAQAAQKGAMRPGPGGTLR